jgi:hypothetical protein
MICLDTESGLARFYPADQHHAAARPLRFWGAPTPQPGGRRCCPLRPLPSRNHT